jgi:hypothetical protein
MLRRKLLLSVLAGTLVLGACGDAGSTGPDQNTSRVSLLLTDAPGELEAAVVTITDIYLQGAEDDSAGRVYLRQNAAVTTDLLSLSNDVLQLVEETEIPAGHYSQLRFVITGAYLEVENADGGTSFYATSPDYEGLPAGATVDGALKCPSCAQSGFKVLLDGASTSDDTSDPIDLTGDRTLLVDFDVSRSFGKPAGKSGNWILKPVLKATSFESAATVTVTLASGTGVTLPLVGDTRLTLGELSATLTSSAGGDPKTVALTDENQDGIYEARFRYVAPGSYQVGFTSQTEVSFTTAPALPSLLTVTSGASTTAAFTLTGATAE